MITDEQKLELLWKSKRGVASTSSLKDFHNEQFVSSQPIFQQNFWTDSDKIPKPALNVVNPIGNELWFDVVSPKLATRASKTIVDSTSDSKAWICVADPTIGLTNANRYLDWIPETYDKSYTIKVWAGDPTSVQTSTRLYPFARNQEWVFDYSSGILYFVNNVPEVAIQNGIWIEGWRYTGIKGREDQSGSTNTSKIRTFTFTSGVIDPSNYADFTLKTGGRCVLVQASCSSAATLECHAMASRDDTNPYRFVAISTHLKDDGSYVIQGNRYYGERFINLVNMDDPSSDETYWRVYNNRPTPVNITVVVNVT